jgi:ATP synthase protein I
MPFNRPIPDRNPPTKGSAGVHSLVEAEKLTQIAFLLPSAVLVGWGAGALAEKHWHQKWMVAAGLILGCASGLMSVVRVALATERAAAKSEIAGSGRDRGSGTAQ